MKKVIICFLMLLSFFSCSYAYEQDLSVILNGDTIKYDNISGYPYENEQGYVMVPMIKTIEDMSGNVVVMKNGVGSISKEIDQYESSHYYIKLGSNSIDIYVNQDIIQVNNRVKLIKSKSIRKDGIIYIPIQEIAEYMGYYVEYTPEKNVISIFKGDGSVAKISSQEIPKNAYRVSYFDSNNPNEVVYTEISDRISFIANDEVHGISPENLKVNWIGDIEFPKEVTKEINIAQGWSTTQLIINGEDVYGDSYTFKKGLNRIEVKHVNNWHTADLAINFLDHVEEFSENLVSEKLKSLNFKDPNYEYFGMYESYNSNHDVNVELKSTNKEVVLFLSSYGSVNWKIKNPNNVKLKAIIYNSYEPGTNVDYNGIGEVQKIFMTDLIRAYELYPSHYKAGHDYHFDNMEFEELNKQIKRVTGKELSGFTRLSNRETTLIPETIINSEVKKSIDEAFEEAHGLENEEPQKPSNLFGNSKESWFDQFSQGTAVPTNSFNAYYIDTKKPNEIIKKDKIEEVAVNYAWDEFMGIESEDFGAYFVGDFVFDVDTLKELSVYNSWAFTRVWIDGKVVYDNGNNIFFTEPYFFKKGKHRIEVEYINDWHTTEMQFAIRDLEKTLTNEEVNEFVKTRVDKKTKVYVISEYDSNNIDLSNKIEFKNRDEDVFLILYSYSPIIWKIDDLKNNKIKGVICINYNKGSDVRIKGIKTENYKYYNGYLDLEYLSDEVTQISRKDLIYRQLKELRDEFGISEIHGVTVGKSILPTHTFID